MAEPWWDPNTFGAWFGAIAGGVGGTIGGLVGTLAGVLIPRGKGRSLILSLMVLCFVAGLAMLGFGLYALAQGQPYGIWYGPVLCGSLFVLLFGFFIPMTRSMYAQVEQRQVDAEGIRRS